MNLLHFLDKQLTGQYFKQEFLCVADGAEQERVKVEIVFPSKYKEIDITDCHLLLGAGPVFVGVIHPDVENQPLQIITLRFSLNSLMLGTIELKQTSLNKSLPAGLLLFELITAQNNLENPAQQFIAHTRHWIRRIKGKAFLSWTANEAIRLLYSVPRRVSVISIASSKLMNIFPTDLNGPVNDAYYTISLRKGGKALEQAKTFKNIAICDIKPALYKEVLAWGKNHMQNMQVEEKFGLSGFQTANFQIPLPEGATAYRELELMQVLPLGFYELLVFKIISKQTVDELACLSTVHAAYASWRLRNGLGFEYLH